MSSVNPQFKIIETVPEVELHWFYYPNRVYCIQNRFFFVFFFKSSIFKKVFDSQEIQVTEAMLETNFSRLCDMTKNSCLKGEATFEAQTSETI